METYRGLQEQFDAIMDEVAGGAPVTDILIHAHPGSGKSRIPVILAHRLKDFLSCWAVPRLSLQSQGESAFKEPWVKQVFGDDNIEFRASDGNDVDPARETNGYITTHAAVSVNPVLHTEFLGTPGKTCLFSDECHHLRQEKKYVSALYGAASLRVLMSGSWDRHDGRQVAWIPYYEINGEQRPVDEHLSSRLREHQRFIRYSRADALSDHAIIPIQFDHGDGPVLYDDSDGERIRHEKLSSVNDTEARHALFTALTTEFAGQLLNSGVASWRKDNTGRLLVVCMNQRHAADIQKELQSTGVDSVIATTNQPEAAKTIKSFRAGQHDCLVSVAMAHEGLDVPDLTHGICLTYTRSRQWIEQLLNRLTRVCSSMGPWSQQTAKWFVPDDPLMNAIIELYRKETLDALREENDGGSGGNSPPPARIVPLASDINDRRLSYLDASSSPMAKAMAYANKNGQDLSEVIKLIEECGCEIAPPKPNGNGDLKPGVSVREGRYKTTVQDLCSAIDATVYRGRNGATNGVVKKRFGKSRTEMCESELRRVWIWLHQEYLSHAPYFSR